MNSHASGHRSVVARPPAFRPIPGNRAGRFTLFLLVALLAAGMDNLRALDLGNIRLVDEAAGTNTLLFYANLMKLADAPGFAFGRQGATDQGVGWSGTPPYSRSDIYDVIAGLNGGVGDYEAVDGYNMEWILKYTTIPGTNNPKANYPGEPLFSVALDTANAPRRSAEIQAAFARGEIIALHAPLDNPDAEVGGGNNSITNSHPERGSLVSRCLPAGYGTNVVNGDLYPVLQNTFDSFAQFIQGDAGLGLTNLANIPILFRPWHEWNFPNDDWWGAAQCSSNEYVALWQFTVTYLRDVKGLHNLIYVWAPSLDVAGGEGSAAAAETNYFSRWPGDTYADVLAGDCYYTMSNGNYSNLTELLPMMLTNGIAKNKVVALSEIGPKSGILSSGTNRFWMNNFLRPLLRDLGTNAAKVAYAMTWDSGGTTNSPNYFSTWPQPGVQAQEQDFFEFWNDPLTIFQASLPDMLAGSAYTFTPTDDAFVYAGAPDTNYGGNALLEVQTNVYASFLKFNVTGIPPGQTVAGVRLKLWSETANQNVTVYAVADTNWTEGTVTWNNQPVMGAALKTLGVATNSQAVFSLPGTVTGNGWVSVGLQGDSNVLGAFDSKESGTPTNWPQLEVVVVDSPSSNHWPLFSSNALVAATAVVGLPYNATLTGAATDADAGDTLTFDIILGPDWLTVSTNGVLGGTPGAGDTNPAIATVRVRDQFGAFAIAQLTIPVSSNPVLQPPILITSGQIVLSWTALPGTNYQLQYKTNLSQPSWLNLGNSITATNSILSATNSIGSNPQGYYRVWQQ